MITGGSSGIGKSFIELGRKLKPELVICNLSRSAPPENIFPNARKSLNHFTCDLSESGGIERVADEVREFIARAAPTGGVLLVNNSGIGAFGRFPEPDLAHELRMVELNVRAVVELTGRLLPLLRERGGAIMNLASTAAFQPTAGCATYGATKAFVLNWTVALDAELRGSGVRALAVCPGTTRTDFFRRAGVGVGVAGRYAMTSEDVAEEAFRALAKGKSLVVTGWRNKLLAFIGARAPKPMAARVAAWLMRERLARREGKGSA